MDKGWPKKTPLLLHRKLNYCTHTYRHTHRKLDWASKFCSIVCITQYGWSNKKLTNTHFSGDSWIRGVSKLKRMYAAERVIKRWKNIHNHMINFFPSSLPSPLAHLSHLFEKDHLFLTCACVRTHTHTHPLPFGILNFLSFLNHRRPRLSSTILTGNSMSGQSEGFSVKSVATGRHTNKNG